MKTNRLLLTLFAISLLCSCDTDSIRITSNDEVTYRTVELGDFNSIEIANNMNAYITFSDHEEQVKIEANEKLHKYITTKKEGDKLIIKLKNNLSIKGKETLNVFIHVKYLDEFKVFADSKIILQTPLVSNHTKITLAADSHFYGELDVNYLNLNASADSKIDVFGNVTTLDANLAADSKLLDYDLVVDYLKINMAADCDAFLTVTQTIDIDAAADCVLRYKGVPNIVNQNLKSDSKIVHTN